MVEFRLAGRAVVAAVARSGTRFRRSSHLYDAEKERTGVRFALRGEGRVPPSDDDVLVGQGGQRRKGEHEVLVTGPAGQQLTWQCPFLTWLINKRHSIALAIYIVQGTSKRLFPGCENVG